MRITTIGIKNFRLLKDVTLELDERTTVIVGRNNSGKTSLTELFRRVLAEKTPSFRLEDFSLSTHDGFWNAFVLHQGGKGAEEEVRAALPTIEIRLTVSYDTGLADLGPLSDFIIDLDPELSDAVLLVSYELAKGNIGPLFDAAPAFDPDGDELAQKSALFKLLKERVPKLYKGILRAMDPNDAENQRELDWRHIRSLLQGGFITAQRGLDDVTNRERDRDVLGKILEGLFRTAKSPSADPGDQESAKNLDAAVEKMQDSIGEEFENHLRTLLPALTLFGYPGLIDPGLSTETTLDVDNLLANHTLVRYAGANGITLPETYNGLGTRNLIFILLQLLEFFKSFQASEIASGINVVFIEEPEAHLHPQMQEVFIRKLAEIAKAFADTYNDGIPWPVQFVVTTHSPHMANEASFDSTRYFISAPESPGATTCATRIKDLSTGLNGVPGEDKSFLHKYMTLTRCDLLFADKAVLIEGTTERLLFPQLIKNLVPKAASSKLASQYISVVEVGGAYAHRFFGLLEFLELQTLILTDLDSVDAADGSRACKVSEGTHTSNACIKEWFGDHDVTPTDLIAKQPNERLNGVVSLAYQVPESDGAPCGRSFEDAFMLANRDLFAIAAGTNQEIEQSAWEKAKAIKNKKSEFALKHAIDAPDWSVPRYISDGLIWLAGNPDAAAQANVESEVDSGDAT